MRSRDFAYWLKGYFELAGTEVFVNSEHVDLIEKHLNMVFEVEKVKTESWDFCIWLKGCIDMVKQQSYNKLSQNQIKIIHDKLNSIFVHEIDPSFGLDKEKLNKIHNPLPYTPSVPYLDPNEVWATNPTNITIGPPSSPYISTGYINTNPGQSYILPKIEHQGQSVSLSYSTGYNLPYADRIVYSC